MPSNLDLFESVDILAFWSSGKEVIDNEEQNKPLERYVKFDKIRFSLEYLYFQMF